MSFAYDEGGKMTSLVTPSGAVHGFSSTPRGARTGYTAPISGAYAYAYDGAGRLKTITSPSGDVVTNTYSGEFLASTSFAGGTIGYTHLPCGKLSSTTRGAETSRLTYDGPLVTREVRGGSVPATLSFAYDTDLRPTSFGYAGGTQTYAYDPDGLIVSAAPFTVSRDASSGLAHSVTAPGFAVSRTYSEYGEIDAAASAASGYTLTRDAAGRIVSKTETTAAGTHTWVYAYDGLGRLSTATRDGVLAESYSYDAQGNRTAMRAPVRGIDDTVTALFDAEDRAVRIGDATSAFTDDGYLASRTTSAGATTYSYTGLGELAAVTLEDGRVVSYAYDAAGRRVSRSVDGAVVERYLWADATRLLATYDAAGTLTRRFLYADARTPYAMDTPAGRYFLHYDQVGSLVAVTDSTGAVVETTERDSFGNMLADSNAGFAVPLGFAGGLTDADTGLTLFGARDYDPATGRWCAKDPIGFAGGDANLYGYCLGDPVGLVDPSGTVFRELADAWEEFLRLMRRLGEDVSCWWARHHSPADGTPYGGYNLEVRPSLPSHQSELPDGLDMGMKIFSVVPVVGYAGSAYLFTTDFHQWTRGDAPLGDPVLDLVGTVYKPVGYAQTAVDFVMWTAVAGGASPPSIYAAPRQAGGG